MCADLKIIGLFRGIQSDYINLCYFLCEWDIRAKDNHYKTKVWPIREISAPGENCFRNLPLFRKDKILLPPLHIKLGFMKNSVKAMDKCDKGLEHLRERFLKISDAKLKEGIFHFNMKK
jgi:hypothetical protein